MFERARLGLHTQHAGPSGQRVWAEPNFSNPKGQRLIVPVGTGPMEFVGELLALVGESEKRLQRGWFDLQERLDPAKEQSHEFEQVGEALSLAAQLAIA